MYEFNNQRKLTFHQSCLGNNILCVIANMRGAWLGLSYICEAVKCWHCQCSNMTGNRGVGGESTATVWGIHTDIRAPWLTHTRLQAGSHSGRYSPASRTTVGHGLSWHSWLIGIYQESMADSTLIPTCFGQ